MREIIATVLDVGCVRGDSNLVPVGSQTGVLPTKPQGHISDACLIH